MIRSIRVVGLVLICAILGAANGSIRIANAQKLANPLKVAYQFPSDGASLIPRETNIMIRPGDLLDARTVSATLLTVSGSLSGKHTGKLVLSDDKKTLSFTPSVIFIYTEKVSVAFGKGLKTSKGVAVDPFSFTFKIGNPPAGRKALTGQEYNPVGDDVDPVLVRSIGITQLPNLSDTIPAGYPVFRTIIMDHPAEGQIFTVNFDPSPYPTHGLSYLTIMNDSSRPTFTRALAGKGFDFKIQKTGLLTYYDEANGKFFGLDSNYRVVDSFWCSGGYKSTDIHDLEVLPNGHALLLHYDTEVVDMSSKVLGGEANAQVCGAVIEEIDQSKTPIFIWRSLDSGHFAITDETRENLLLPNIDYVHANSIQMDDDGNLLLSARHMDEITKINRDSGTIMWRLGGKNNQFTIIGDSVPFSHQHHVRRIENGHITFFDNGNFRQPKAYSRAVEYALDEKQMTATLVWQYRHAEHDTDIAAGFMGSVQRLANGNTFIGWGADHTPMATEVRPDGSIAYEADMYGSNLSYRVFRFPWNGKTQLGWTAAVGDNQAPSPSLELRQSYPNPVQASAHIVYSLPVAGQAELKLYDLLGRELRTVASGFMAAGFHSSDIDASTLAPGVYRYTLTIGTNTVSRQMVVVR